jgi:small GTP-binding protein
MFLEIRKIETLDEFFVGNPVWQSSGQALLARMRKILVIGAAGCGKTSLVRRLCDNKFDPNEQHTVGLNMWILRDDTTQLWDMSGQRQYEQKVLGQLSGADGILLCYSCANADSFNELSIRWFPALRDRNCTPIYVVGTRSDGVRQVTVKDVAGLVSAMDVKQFSECSAKMGVGLDNIAAWIGALPVPRDTTTLEASFDQEQLLTQSVGCSAFFGCWFCCRPAADLGDEGE